MNVRVTCFHSTGLREAGREVPLEVALARDDLRLVDRARPRHEVAELAGHDLAVALEALDRVARRPAAALGEPARVAEVVQGDERLEALLRSVPSTRR